MTAGSSVRWEDAGTAALFAAASHPEGSRSWFRVVAATTLAPGEAATLVEVQGAALPLVRTAPGRLRALAAPYTTLYPPPLGTMPGQAEALGRAVALKVRRRLDLEALDPAQPGLDALVCGLRAGGLAVDLYEQFGNWYREAEDFAGYWAARPSELRATVKRRSRRLGARIAFRWEASPAGIAALGDAYDAIYADSWKKPEPDPGFIPALRSALGAQGTLRVGLASIDGEPVAAQIWLVQGTAATIFKLAHRKSYDADSPGSLLTAWMIERAIVDEGVRLIDYGRGDDGYKKLWLEKRRPRLGLIAVRPGSPAGLVEAAREVWLPQLKRRFRQ